ncbi:hypothetical protein HanXRQr2_Chr11g0502051 [Helianthus annuus]|uniref:Putative nucleic acid-binding, OB-fold protein n=1 Tax=Helianthus annuus TaxID=4232 RepID=A0A251TCH1_HELAN|nr:hypothetical protein HanXRQr2_Chr11g0502051 [Helianthus annuus]KAJ0502368.1 hypothetical protein HanHA300_Chr11g0412121 [Helianthus annuus]KAJ0518289.1 hypothetical protein HanHA89_Chr11g0435781 [Helianthus annuus]KAJ0686323.1 hypothetical protein HanLR1_Chr11g0413461 [Helianthus annuus]KAJ0876032.1 hypothetical protein HanPSC8_Chr11g0483751 [Helianthus annuus]
MVNKLEKKKVQEEVGVCGRVLERRRKGKSFTLIKSLKSNKLKRQINTNLMHEH